MIFIKLTNIETKKLRGLYKLQHKCEPIKVSDNFYFLHDSIRKIPELQKKINFKLLPTFKSSDIEYKNYLKQNVQAL